MAKMGLTAIYQRPRTSHPHPEHRIYPYLLRELDIVRPNQVWCADVTYIPMRRGFLYLVAVMDWATRQVLTWRLSNTMDAGFCVDALEEAIDRYGRPEIFNTDQGSQFTSNALWMAGADGWTTSSSSACGGRSNTNASISMLSKRDPNCVLVWISGSSITITNALTRPLPGEPRPRHMGIPAFPTLGGMPRRVG